MKKCIVVIVQHALFDQQMDILGKKYDKVDYLRVPAAGWTLAQINDVCDDLLKGGADIIMASPIPALLMKLSKDIAYSVGVADGDNCSNCIAVNVYTFHNDNRIKKQFGDKIVMTVAPDGWVLI